MKTACVALALAIWAGMPDMSAQDVPADEPATRYRHSVGIGAGFVTGYGLSYRYWPHRLGVQLNFAPYEGEDVSRYSAGVTFLYPLIPGRVTSLFVYQGNHYYYNSEITYYDNKKEISTEPTPNSEHRLESYFNNGLGIGMEIVFAKRIGWNLMMGYAAYKNFTQVNITGETGLYFKF